MPYDPIESQKLIRQSELAKTLPGGDLIVRIAVQLKAADSEIVDLNRRIRDFESPVVRRVARRPVVDAEPSPTPAPAPPLAPPAQAAAVASAAAKPTDPRAYMNPYLGGNMVESPPPIPFAETADPTAAPPVPVIPRVMNQAPTPDKPKRGRRRKHVAP